MRAIITTLLLMLCASSAAKADEERTFRGKTMEGWIEVLRNKTAPKLDRSAAIGALGCFGKEATAAIPDLIEEFRTGDLKEQALSALIRMQAAPEVTVPPVIERFIDQGCWHRTRAGAIGFSPWMERSLIKIGGPAVPALLKILNGQNMEMRVCAANVLGEIGPAARAAIPDLILIAKTDVDDYASNTLRRQAITSLGQIGAEAKDAIPILTRILDHEWADGDLLRHEAITALDGLGAPPVRWLRDRLLDGNFAAAHDLVRLGPKAREAIPALRNALSDKNPTMRVSAAYALAYIDSSDTRVIPILIEELRKPNGDEYWGHGCVCALGRFGPKAGEAIPSLINLVKKGDVDRDILETLVQIDPEGRDCVPALIAALKNSEYYTGEAVANCLGLLGPRAKDAVPALSVALTREFDDTDGESCKSQVAAAKALRRIGPEAKSAMPALIAALKYRHTSKPRDGEPASDPDYSAAEAAAEVLGSFGAEASVAVPALIEAVQTEEKDSANQFVRAAAILALGQIGPAAKDAVPILRAMLYDKNLRDQFETEVHIALVQLSPDGKILAEKRLTKTTLPPMVGSQYSGRLLGRERVLAALGRMSLEADAATRFLLESIDESYGRRRLDDEGYDDNLESALEEIAQLGIGARLAIPRLQKLSEHANPWIRLYAKEALERINPPASK